MPRESSSKREVSQLLLSPRPSQPQLCWTVDVSHRHRELVSMIEHQNYLIDLSWVFYVVSGQQSGVGHAPGAGMTGLPLTRAFFLRGLNSSHMCTRCEHNSQLRRKIWGLQRIQIFVLHLSKLLCLTVGMHMYIFISNLPSQGAAIPHLKPPVSSSPEHIPPPDRKTPISSLKISRNQ